jgi:hypothetical protein
MNEFVLVFVGINYRINLLSLLDTKTIEKPASTMARLSRLSRLTESFNRTYIFTIEQCFN